MVSEVASSNSLESSPNTVGLMLGTIAEKAMVYR